MQEPTKLMTSGEILGAIVEILDVRGRLGQSEVGDSTLKRVLRGEQVKPASLAEAVDATVKAVWLEYFEDQAPPIDWETRLHEMRDKVLRWANDGDGELRKMLLKG
mgnify:CR=1 FL=1